MVKRHSGIVLPLASKVRRPLQVCQEVAHIQHRVTRTHFLKIHQCDPAIRQEQHLIIVEVIMCNAGGGAMIE